MDTAKQDSQLCQMGYEVAMNLIENGNSFEVKTAEGKRYVVMHSKSFDKVSFIINIIIIITIIIIIINY